MKVIELKREKKDLVELYFKNVKPYEIINDFEYNTQIEYRYSRWFTNSEIASICDELQIQMPNRINGSIYGIISFGRLMPNGCSTGSLSFFENKVKKDKINAEINQLVNVIDLVRINTPTAFIELATSQIYNNIEYLKNKLL